MAEDLVKIEHEFDPDRCQALHHGKRQCFYKSMDGSNFCKIHGGNKGAEKQEKENITRYHIGKWRARLDRFSSESNIKNLREEIGVLRMVLEQRLERCDDAHDMILQSGPISDIIMKIEKIVSSCHKLEGSMGQLLDKQEIIRFSSEVIGIITEILVEQPEKISEIAERIISSVDRIGDNDDTIES